MHKGFDRESRALSRLYHDEMDVYRVKYEKNPETLETISSEVCVYQSRACGLSQGSVDAPERDTITAQVSDTYTIFADVNVHLQENDRVIVRTADGQLYEGRAGKTFAIRSHGETPFQVEKVS